MTKVLPTVLVVIFLVGLGTSLGLLTPQLVLQAQAPAKQKADKDIIVGTWRITKGRINGKDAPDEYIKNARLVFTKDGKMSFRLGEEVSKEGKYQLPAAGQIDLPQEQADPSPGIYKFASEDRLTICMPNGSGGKRPTEFSGEMGKGQVRLDLQRVKPGEDKLTPEEIAKNKVAVDKLRQAAARAQNINNLKQIGLAMHNYHDQHGSLPAHAIYGKDGKTPLLSWRVALLPYLGENALFQEFKLDESWDSTHNKKLIAKMPKVYEIPIQKKKGAGLTHYQVFTGPDSLFDGPKKLRLPDITDGTSNTILAIEAKDAVVWSKPDDLLFRKKGRLPALGGLFKHGIGVVFCDGSARTFRLNPPVELLRAVITPSGGEVVDFEKLEP